MIVAQSKVGKKETIDRRVKEKLEKIEEIKVKKTALLGLVFVYPEDFSDDNKLNIHFSYQFKKVDFKPKKFLEELTNYFDFLHSNEVPPIPEKCKDTTNRTHCWMHNYFFDEKNYKEKMDNITEIRIEEVRDYDNNEFYYYIYCVKDTGERE